MKNENLENADVNIDSRFDSGKFNEEIRTRLSVIVKDKPLDTIVQFIETEISNSTQITSFNYTFKCFPEDGAYALYKSIQEIEGFSKHMAINSPSGSESPQTLDVRFADGSRIKVPWGTISLPSLGKDSLIEMQYDDKTRRLIVDGQCEKRYVSLMDDIMDRALILLKTDSIYRGRAIKLDSNLRPSFIDLSKIEAIPMHLSSATEFSLQPIISRIEHAQRCLDQGLELKFGALMEGDYGTGKTLLAFKLAYKAIKNDWGFIYLTDPIMVTEMLDIAGDLCENGQGILTFVEDIDQVLRGDRDKKMNQILNILDGGDTKGRNIISVFTTNHLELIDPTFLRGKRIGSLITLTALDHKTAISFIKNYLKGSLIDDPEMAAQKVTELKIVPAFLAEILDRVKANMVYTNTKTTTCDDILSSIESYKAQMALATTKSIELDRPTQYVELFKELFVTDALNKLNKTNSI